MHKALQVDVAGLSETNSCWTHPHLTAEFRTVLRKFHNQSKAVFGSPSPEIDPVPVSESFQSGGNATIVTGGLVSRVQGSDISDPTGLGRWCGVTLQGSNSRSTSIITAYRVCSGSARSSKLGSAFRGESDFLRDIMHSNFNPRRVILQDLKSLILSLQAKEHSIILMMDANSTIDDDRSFNEFVQECSLHDLHDTDPAPSTFIGAADRRIDYIFGCIHAKELVQCAGTLSYFEGPQSDHRAHFIDIKDPSFLQKAKASPISIERAPHSGNPELVMKYQKAMLKYYSDHRMVERIDHLHQHFSTMPLDEIRSELKNRTKIKVAQCLWARKASADLQNCINGPRNSAMQL